MSGDTICVIPFGTVRYHYAFRPTESLKRRHVGEYSAPQFREPPPRIPFRYAFATLSPDLLSRAASPSPLVVDRTTLLPVAFKRDESCSDLAPVYRTPYISDFLSGKSGEGQKGRHFGVCESTGCLLPSDLQTPSPDWPRLTRGFFRANFRSVDCARSTCEGDRR